MNKKEFYFDLPEALIAQYPLDKRSESRLLKYDRKTGEIEHHVFKDIVQFLKAGDLLVMNDSQVIPARLYGQKASGGRIELLVERLLSPHQFLAHIKASKSPKPGTLIHLDKGYCFSVVEKQDDLYLCESTYDVDDMLHTIGHVPLPPYITRIDESLDLGRYQTVYAKHKGSVAAPTAGLHFDETVLENLIKKGIGVAYVTLHVGAGTFRPVRVDSIHDHKMHAERFTVGQPLCDAIAQCKKSGGRVIAVGTTSLRTLESAARTGDLAPQTGDTDIFIYPGYQFKICDGLITNFHLPESTLLMLVSAFIGHQEAMAMYETAIRLGYRFFSYGDTSLLL